MLNISKQTNTHTYTRKTEFFSLAVCVAFEMSILIHRNILPVHLPSTKFLVLSFFFQSYIFPIICHRDFVNSLQCIAKSTFVYASIVVAVHDEEKPVFVIFFSIGKVCHTQSAYDNRLYIRQNAFDNCLLTNFFLLLIKGSNLLLSFSFLFIFAPIQSRIGYFISR